MGGGSWLRSPCPAAGLTCPLTSLAQIWGYGGGFALHRTDAEAEMVFPCVLSLSRGRAAAGYFWDLVFIPGDGGREMLPSNP